MDEKQAIELIYEGLSGQESIPVRLRMGEGLDRAQLERVKQAIHFLSEKWKGVQVVPKRIAEAFVDIQSAMEWGREQYTEKEQEEIEDAAYELVELAYNLFESERQR